MNTKIATLALVLCACGASVQNIPSMSDVACETDNGLFVMKPTPIGWCDEVQGVEDRIFQAFRDVAKVDDRFNSSMARTRGYRIVVKDEAIWADGAGGYAIGQCDCRAQIIYLNHNRPGSNVLGHEMAHAVQGCEPLGPYDFSGGLQTYYHSNWGPIFDALKKQNLRP